MFLKEQVRYMDPETNNDMDTLFLGLTVFKDYATVTFDSKNDDFKQKKFLKIRQDKLIKIGVAELVCKLFCMNKNQKIFDMALNVGIKLLENGNKNSQKEFLRIFKQLEDKDIIAKILQNLKQHFDVIAV